MRILLRILFTAALSGIFGGFYIRSYHDYGLGEKIIGFSVLFAVFIYMPIFLRVRWKGKRLQDYTLTPENLAKMNAKKEK